MSASTDSIRKTARLDAPIERVWKAISDAGEFGAWFGAEFDGPFTPGARLTCRITPTKVDPEVAKLQEPHAGTAFEICIERIEPPRLFSFRWHPYAVEARSYDAEPMTLVEFTLEAVAGGTLVTVTESGFDALPLERRAAGVCRERGGMDAPAGAGRQVHGAPAVAAVAMPASRVTTARLLKAAPVFTALGDETRLHLVSRLCKDGPLSISTLTTGTSLSRQAVTKHLKVLADAGLARSGRRGREQLWQIEARRMTEVQALLRQIAAQWDDALCRLKAFVEREPV